MAALWMIVGFTIGAAAVLLFARARTRTASDQAQLLRDERDASAREVAELRARSTSERDAASQDLAGVREELAQARTALATSQTELKAGREAHAERMVQLRETEQRIDERVKAACADALGGTSKQLVAIAKSELGKERAEAKCEIDAEHNRLGEMFGRVDQTLGKVAGKLDDVERERIASREQLSAQLQAMRDSQKELMAGTQALVGALRRPHVRGRWGEIQLRNIVEAAGMLPHVDFDEQPSLPGEDGLLRPDARVHLPGSREVIIDAKVPMEAYMELLSASEPAEQERLLAQHARHVRAHLTALDSKAYWERAEGSPDFVVMFIPNDQVLLAAMEADRTLAEEVARRRVVIATPMNLMALLRIIALGWRQEALAENAREIEKLGRELYKRLGTFAGKLQTLGKRIGSLVTGYNDALASFEGRLLPGARQMANLGLVAADQKLTSSEPITLTPRELRAPALDDAPLLGAGEPDAQAEPGDGGGQAAA
jgi:DNA recombination protein RmuC